MVLMFSDSDHVSMFFFMKSSWSGTRLIQRTAWCIGGLTRNGRLSLLKEQ